MSHPRRILHVDMDAFYASVEQRDRPEWASLPVVVGGTGDRGVVSAASYQARAFGIRSAMPGAEARRLCPDAIFVKPDMPRYREASERIFECLSDYSPLVEPLSLDEAFVDLTGSERLMGDAVDIARAIKRDILARTRLVASVGVSINKFLAKLASDFDKPDGLYVVLEDQVQGFLDPLPVRRIWGVGKRMAEQFRHFDIHTVADLRQQSMSTLTRMLGNQAAHYYHLARGEDIRPVRVQRPDRSISHETTFDTDVLDDQVCEKVLMSLCGDVGRRLRRKQLSARTLSLKVRLADFSTQSRSKTFDSGLQDDRSLFQCVQQLWQLWRAEHPARAIRLLGVSTRNFETGTGLFTAEGDDLSDLSDRIRDRFGSAAVRPARLLPTRDEDQDETGEEA